MGELWVDIYVVGGIASVREDGVSLSHDDDATMVDGSLSCWKYGVSSTLLYVHLRGVLMFDSWRHHPHAAAPI